MTNKAKSVLLIGGSAVGKTHYGGQLLCRLQQRDCRLRMRGAAESLAPFEEVLHCLCKGITAGHTSASYQSVILPVELAGDREVDLIWPDYSGEQIKEILEQRRLSLSWRQRLLESDGWIFFIRLDQIRSYEDILSRPTRDLQARSSSAEATDFHWSDQAKFIELLQFFLFAKGVRTAMRVHLPALCIVLSCWDEISSVKEGTQPHELMKDRMPLFSDYISSNWISGQCCVFGLSSLGKRLDKEKPDEGYLARGPEEFGYVIQPDGTPSTDLTLPVFKTIDMAS